jgi:putative endonuclease
MNWYLYILECSNEALYTGITNNLEKRIKKHNDGSDSRYTAQNKPVKLIYTEKYDDKSSALKFVCSPPLVCAISVEIIDQCLPPSP